MTDVRHIQIDEILAGCTGVAIAMASIDGSRSNSVKSVVTFTPGKRRETKANLALSRSATPPTVS